MYKLNVVIIGLSFFVWSSRWGTAWYTKDTGTNVPRRVLLRIRSGLLVKFIALTNTWPLTDSGNTVLYKHNLVQ